MENKKSSRSLYDEAHLVVAAVRVLEHKRQVPPAIEDICQALSLSGEEGNRICRKLKALEIIDIIEGAFGNKLYIKDHQRIETLPQDIKDDRLQTELKKFKDSQKELSKKIETIQAEQSKKKQDLFAKLNQQLKKDLDKK